MNKRYHAYESNSIRQSKRHKVPLQTSEEIIRTLFFSRYGYEPDEVLYTGGAILAGPLREIEICPECGGQCTAGKAPGTGGCEYCNGEGIVPGEEQLALFE